MELPVLASDYPVHEDAVAHYREKGWTLLRGVASADEVAPYRDVLTGATLEFARQRLLPLEARDTYGKAFIQYGNLCWTDERIRRFVFARRFAKIAADLMGVEGVRLYHDQALYKEPGGGLTPWHQDQQYWPLDGVRCVTMWMPLVDCDAAMGTMRFASRSQNLGYLGPLNISDESEAQLETLIAERGYRIDEAGDMKAGDATFHNGWTIHGAPGNLSADRMREVMTVIYMESEAVVTAPDSPQRQGDYNAFFPDRQPGQKADGQRTPLLYHRTDLP